MIAISGTIGFSSHAVRDAAVAESVELQRSTRCDELGCMAYVFAADPVEPTIVHVFELWRDAVSLAAHFDHPNYAAMRQLLRRHERSGPSSTAKYRIDRAGPVYGADGVATASFD